MKRPIRQPSPPQIKTARIGRRGVLAVLAFAALLISGAPCWLPGQTFTVIHSFTDIRYNFPSYLIISGNTLYGTTGTTVFKVNTDGTGFTALHSFTAASGFTDPSTGAYVLTNSDGFLPTGLILSGSTLYGICASGTGAGSGTVFAVNTDGTGFTELYTFTALTGSADNYGWYPVNSDGIHPSSLIVAGTVLYGTTVTGGSAGTETIFALNTDGTGFQTLYSFTAANLIYGTFNTPYADGVYIEPFNSDGAYPNGVTLSGDTLYGTAASGGTAARGTIFSVNTDGSGFTTLHTFSTTACPQGNQYPPEFCPNSDGAFPSAGLTLSGNTLYGTASWGGASGNGTVFEMNTDGSAFATVHSFSANTSYDGAIPFNAEGDDPMAALFVAGNTLYGTAVGGGTADYGTVFAVNTDGSGFTVLHIFTGHSDGGGPYAPLILSGNTLYGTVKDGGSGNHGMIFSISFSPQLTITSSAKDAVLTWPTNYAGFDYTGYTLQSTTSLASPVWAAVSPVPDVVNNQFSVTNPISGTQQFYRLAPPN